MAVQRFFGAESEMGFVDTWAVLHIHLRKVLYNYPNQTLHIRSSLRIRRPCRLNIAAKDAYYLSDACRILELILQLYKILSAVFFC